MALTNLSQITTSGISTLADINLNNLTGVAATFTGNVTVGGVLTYDDVTNVDSVGLITARSGIDASGTSIFRGPLQAQDNLEISGEIVHLSDADTRIRFPSNDTITLQTAGNERLRITSDGKVGIGLTNPGEKLSVNGGIEARGGGWIIARSGNNSGYAYIKNPLASGSQLAFLTSDTERLRILSAGRIGIGTDTTTAKLEITDAIGTTGEEILLKLQGRATKNVYLDINADANRRGVIRFKSAGTDKWSIGRGDSDELSDSSFFIATGSSGGNTAKLVINSDGNVGINKTAPADRLHVGGKIRFGNNNTYYGVIEHEEGVTGANIYTSQDAGGHIFKRNASELIRIQPAGGISFNGDTAAANALDDYEEGTWTPNFTNCTYTPTVQFGRYTKIGRYVYCTITMDGNSMSGSGIIGLEGLPFSSTDVSDDQQRSAWHPANGGHMVGLSINDARFRVNGTTMQGVKGATGNTSYMSANQLTSGTFQFTGDFSYYTA